MEQSVAHTSLVFLRCVCVIYLFAFLSLYVQIPGLNGADGILPARSELDSVEGSATLWSRIRKMDLMQGAHTLWDQIVAKPTILWLAPELGLNTQYAMELVALTGALISFLGFVNDFFCTEPFFAILWFLYQSLFQVNPIFLGFQWDILLLEVGFICIFVAPFVNVRSRLRCPSTPIRFWLVRWLLFRLMFSSGVVKLTSGCPTWWQLTALDVHFESQCIPTPLAWYAHHLPTWLLHMSVLGAHYIECVVPLFFFLPIRPVRYVAFYLQIFLQVAIIITGNYNFFNLLTIVLCLSLVDDNFVLGKPKKQFTKKGTKNSPANTARTLGYVVTAAIYGASIYYTGLLFGFKIGTEGTPEFKATFGPKELKEVLVWFVPLTMVYGFASYALVVTTATFGILGKNAAFFSKFGQMLKVLSYGFMCSCLFFNSLVPFSTVRPASHSEPPVITALKPIYAQTYRFHISSGYGLFRHMTGVNGRPEVIIEGSNDMKGPWKEYEFKYKPGNVNRAPVMVSPHQPRLDWQMWFAALGTYHDNPWITSLAYRLLKGQPEVLELLDKNSPFQDRPPKFIKATLYTYRYSASKNNGSWWTREKESEYFPIFSADHKPLLEYLQKLNLINVKDWPLENKMLVQILDNFRRLFNLSDPILSIWGICFAAFAIRLT